MSPIRVVPSASVGEADTEVRLACFDAATARQEARQKASRIRRRHADKDEPGRGGTREDLYDGGVGTVRVIDPFHDL